MSNVPQKKFFIMSEYVDRLTKFCLDLGFVCHQLNGQRISTSKDFNRRPSVKGTEIFLGKIPRNSFEDELIPICLKAGKLYQLRLMLDFSLHNRGFAFATYSTPEEAEKALVMLDNYEIRPRTTIGAFKSVNNCRLFFGNIPSIFTKADLIDLLNEKTVDEVVDVIMFEDLLKPDLNRGYAFVEFSSHRFAAKARKQLCLGCLVVKGQPIFVDWADPIPDVDPSVMAQVTKLFLHQLPLNLGKKKLWQYVCRLVEKKTILKVHKQMNYAFVHFSDRESAEIGKIALQQLPFPGIIVEWARPREYSKQLRLESPPTNFCLSLPPKLRRHYKQFINSIMSESSSSSLSEISDESYLSSPVAVKIFQNRGRTLSEYSEEKDQSETILTEKEIKQIQNVAKAAIAAAKLKTKPSLVEQNTLAPVLNQELLPKNNEYFSNSFLPEHSTSHPIQDLKWFLEEKAAHARATTVQKPINTTVYRDLSSNLNITENSTPQITLDNNYYGSHNKDLSVQQQAESLSLASLSLYDGLSYFDSSNEVDVPTKSSLFSLNEVDSFNGSDNNGFILRQQILPVRPIGNPYFDDVFDNTAVSSHKNQYSSNRDDAQLLKNIAGPKLRALWDCC